MQLVRVMPACLPACSVTTTAWRRRTLSWIVTPVWATSWMPSVDIWSESWAWPSWRPSAASYGPTQHGHTSHVSQAVSAGRTGDLLTYCVCYADCGVFDQCWISPSPPSS